MYTSTITTSPELKKNQKRVWNDTAWAGVRNALPLVDDEDTTMTVVARQARMETYEREAALMPTEATIASVSKALGASVFNLSFTAEFTNPSATKVSWVVEDTELSFKRGYTLVASTKRTLNGAVATEEIPELRVIMSRTAKAVRFITSFGRNSTRRCGESFSIGSPSRLLPYVK